MGVNKANVAETISKAKAQAVMAQVLASRKGWVPVHEFLEATRGGTGWEIAGAKKHQQPEVDMVAAMEMVKNKDLAEPLHVAADKLISSDPTMARYLKGLAVSVEKGNWKVQREFFSKLSKDVIAKYVPVAIRDRMKGTMQGASESSGDGYAKSWDRLSIAMKGSGLTHYDLQDLAKSPEDMIGHALRRGDATRAQTLGDALKGMIRAVAGSDLDNQIDKAVGAMIKSRKAVDYRGDEYAGQDLAIGDYYASEKVIKSAGEKLRKALVGADIRVADFDVLMDSVAGNDSTKIFEGLGWLSDLSNS